MDAKPHSPATDVPESPILFRVSEVCQMTGLSRSFVYQSLRSPRGIPCVRIGRAIRVSRNQLLAWIEQQTN